MKAVLMVCSNRDVTLRTTYGSIFFKKDEPRLVNPNMVPEALKVGVLPVNTEETLFDEPVEEKEPVDTGTRSAILEKTIEEIYEANNPDDFTAGDKPSVKAVQRRSKLRKVSAAEIKTVLDKRNKAALEARTAQEKEKLAKKGQKPAEVDPPDDDEYDG